MKFVVNLFVLFIGFLFLMLWIKISIVLLVVLFFGFFLLSIASLFWGNCSKIAQDIISLTKSWMKIPAQILEAYEI